MTEDLLVSSHHREPADVLSQSDLHSEHDTVVVTMLRKISSALGLKQTLAADHHDPGRASTYVTLASELKAHGVPVSQSDCYTCAEPCPDDEQLGAGTVAEAGVMWDGKKPYDDYVLDTYGDVGELPGGFDTDWESELAGSAAGGRGRVVVVSTGKSDWTRDHTVSCSGLWQSRMLTLGRMRRAPYRIISTNTSSHCRDRRRPRAEGKKTSTHGHRPGTT